MNGPYLEVDSVHRALEAMRQGEELGPAHPLAQFTSIRQLFKPAASIGGAAGSDSVVFGTLTRAIQRRLDHQRTFYGLSPISSRQGIQALKDDFSHDNEELEAWSFLYHRYVRTDLALSVDQIYACIQASAPQSRRNLQRRQALGLHRLTHLLARREIRARRKDQRAFLRSRLPFQARSAPFIVGRDVLLESIIALLSVLDSPRHVLIFGPPGIGKKTIAQAAAHHLIDTQAIQNLVWINSPDQFGEELPQRIASELGLIEGSPSLGSYLQMVDSLIVFDQAEGLLDRPDALISIMALLGAARLVICTEHLPPQYPSGIDLAQVAIPELDRENCRLLLSHYAYRLEMDHSLTQGDFSWLLDELGGNPGALIAALREGKRFSKIAHSSAIYQQAWDTVSTLARSVWLLLALLPQATKVDPTVYAILIDTEPDHVDIVLNDLRRAHIVEPQPSNVAKLTPLAQSFADHLLQSSELRLVVEETGHQIANYYVDNKDAIGCQYLLDKAANEAFQPDFLLRLAGLCAPIMEQGGAWASWSAYLEQLADMLTGPDRRWVGLHLGVAFRWMGQWEQAGYWLGAVMREAGQDGDFVMQADAMTELGVIARSQNHYDTATELLSRAEAAYRRRQHLAGLERINAERIQIALDKKDLLEASRLLDEIEAWSPRLLNLAAQVELQNGEVSRALTHAQNAQQGLVDNLPMWARNTAFIGQIYANLQQWSDAIDHLASALVIMEQTGDLLGHARVRLNLGAVYLNLGNVRAALRYLRDLPFVLELLGDVESLQVAKDNLAKLPQNPHESGKRSK